MEMRREMWGRKREGKEEEEMVEGLGGEVGLEWGGGKGERV